MKFTTKSVHIVASVAHLKYLYIYIKYLYAIYMFMVCTYFVQCIKNVQSEQYCRILFHVNESNA